MTFVSFHILTLVSFHVFTLVSFHDKNWKNLSHNVMLVSMSRSSVARTLLNGKIWVRCIFHFQSWSRFCFACFVHLISIGCIFSDSFSWNLTVCGPSWIYPWQPTIWVVPCRKPVYYQMLCFEINLNTVQAAAISVIMQCPLMKSVAEL